MGRFQSRYLRISEANLVLMLSPENLQSRLIHLQINILKPNARLSTIARLAMKAVVSQTILVDQETIPNLRHAIYQGFPTS